MAQAAMSPRMRTTVAVLLLIALALAPTRFTRWLGFLRDPTMTIIAPISGPASALSIALRRGSGSGTHEELELDEARSELHQYRDLYNKAIDRVNELESLVTELQRGIHPLGGYRFTPLEATARVARNSAAGTIEINRGRHHGVKSGTVALTRRTQQIIGIVSRVGLMTSTIDVVTQKRAETRLIRAVVMPRDPVDPSSLRSIVNCQIKAVGDGSFITELTIPADVAASITPGQEVRIKDDQWPATAQMSLIGRVVRVEETADKHPLHRHLRIKPDFDSDLTRVSSMILHIPVDDGAAAPEGATQE